MDGGGGGGVGAMGKGRLYVTLDCHRQNDFCIKMANDESHFIVSFTVRGEELIKSQDNVPKPQLLETL